MTAEVAVMNRQAIALAADSAVTAGTTGEAKVYKSANKLFTLSKYHPVGVMLYGEADLVGLPWETIVKKYRANLGKKAFPTVREYARDFFRYLNRGQIFPPESQRNYVEQLAYVCFLRLRKAIEKGVSRHVASQREVSRTQIKDIVRRIVAEKHGGVLRKDLLPHVRRGHSRRVSVRYRDTIVRAARDVFEKIPVPPDSHSRLCKLIGDICARDDFTFPNSGVVIAGFGERELYPALELHTVEGMAGDVLKYKHERGWRIDHQTTARIIPFAQADVAATIMEGIDPEYHREAKRLLRTNLERFTSELLARLGLAGTDRKRVTQEAAPVLDRAIQSLDEELKAFSREKHVEPIMNIVAILPKDELAAVAETLVNLTSFKRRMSPEAETVGGPVDVAVISKGDGFVWIHRKHYFDPALNPYFMAKYYRSQERNLA